MKKVDIDKYIGKTYNYLLVIAEAESNCGRKVLCVCKCGNVGAHSLWGILNGGTKSCGCYSREKAAIKGKMQLTTHGLSYTSEYQAWIRIKFRCYNEKYSGYMEYGGRGIRVCDRWLNSFENFYADMGKKPTSNHSIDRINVDGNYEPSNCRWATRKEQQRNKTNNVLFTYKGETKCIAEWSEITGLSFNLIQSRINGNWAEDIIFMPSNNDKRRRYDKNRNQTPVY